MEKNRIMEFVLEFLKNIGICHYKKNEEIHFLNTFDKRGGFFLEFKKEEIRLHGVWGIGEEEIISGYLSETTAVKLINRGIKERYEDIKNNIKNHKVGYFY